MWGTGSVMTGGLGLALSELQLAAATTKDAIANAATWRDRPRRIHGL
jgi:hypothetical protein